MIDFYFTNFNNQNDFIYTIDVLRVKLIIFHGSLNTHGPISCLQHAPEIEGH